MRSELKKLDSFTLETSKNHLIRNFSATGAWGLTFKIECVKNSNAQICFGKRTDSCSTHTYVTILNHQHLSIPYNILYRYDLEKQEGYDVVAHERLNESRVTIKWLLAISRSFSNLSAFLDLNGILQERSLRIEKFSKILKWENTTGWSPLFFIETKIF